MTNSKHSQQHVKLRINQLTFTRFIAAISIVIYHHGEGSFLFNNEYLSFIFKQANVGVSYFFVLSGFVMIVAYNKKRTMPFFDYIKNRLARIYPVYLLAIVCILCIKPVGNTDLFLNILMLQSWYPNKALTVNYPGWSLSVEIFFYIAFPFLLTLLYKRVNLKKTACIIVFFWILSQILFHLAVQKNGPIEIHFYNKQDLLYNPLLHFNEFLIGNLTGLYFLNQVKTKQNNHLFPIIITLLILLFLLKFPFGLNYHNGLLAIIFAPLILLLATSNDKLTKFFSKNIFVFLGEISFSVYILQTPIWLILSDTTFSKYLHLNPEIHLTLSFLIRFTCLLLASSLCYLYFENPLRNKIKNIKIDFLFKNKA